MNFSKLILLICLITLISCQKEAEETLDLKMNRTEFIKGKTTFEITESFNLLSKKQKFELWQDKLNQLLSEGMPNRHFNLISSLKKEHQKFYLGENNNLRSISIELAKILSADEFEKMFFTLKDYDFKNLNNTFIVDENLISFLKEIDYTYDNLDQTLSNRTGGPIPPPCNCNWSCGLQTINPGVGVTDNCTETTSGCGFMGMSGCYRRVYLK